MSCQRRPVLTVRPPSLTARCCALHSAAGRLSGDRAIAAAAGGGVRSRGWGGCLRGRWQVFPEHDRGVLVAIRPGSTWADRECTCPSALRAGRSAWWVLLELLDEVGERGDRQGEAGSVRILAVSHGDSSAWRKSSQFNALSIVHAAAVRTLAPLDGCHVRSSGRCLIRSIRSANSAVVRVRWLPSGFLLSRTPMPDESCPSSTQCSSLTPLLWVLFRHWMVMCAARAAC